MKYIVALDQGTTSSRAVVIDEKGRKVAAKSLEYKQIYPQPGWVEHDPFDILNTQTETIKLAVSLAGIDPHDIAAIGITNQRETTFVWNKETGKPVCNAIVWQCRRTAGEIEKLVKAGKSDMIREKTGLIPDAYFSGSKIAWILKNVPGAMEDAKAGKLLFGTVETWLIWNLTENRVHVSDVSNASRTMLFNIHEMNWDKELLELLDIPESMLPKLVDNSGIVGYLKKDVLGVEIPIAGMAGDQQAALFGQACFEKGMIKTTYGTGGFLLMQTGDNIVESKNGLLSTVAWRINGKTCYALEGSVFVAGAVLQWLRDELKLITSAPESDVIVKTVSDTAGVYLVPAFTGLGAPYWDMYGRGVMVGLTRGATRAHIVRAALESIAFQMADVVETMRLDSGLELNEMRVDGGASVSDFTMQFESDLLNMTVVRPTNIETTAMGAAYLAGLAVGLWKGLDELAALWQADKTFTAQMPRVESEKRMKKWHKAVERAKAWAEDDEE